MSGADPTGPGPADAGPTGLAAAIAASGLVAPDSGGVVLLSGGADSCALAFGLAGLDPRPDLHALHLNYGLRPESGEDEAACAGLCERLGIELTVVRPERGAGNLHAWAREERYFAAERVRQDRGLEWIAVAHTASDLAETVIYRLAVSPGSRPLVAMPAKRGAVIRPLLALSREEVRRAAESADLPFVDDRSNDDPAFARARIRNEVLPVLADLNPSVLSAISRTRDDLAEEIDFLSSAGAALVDGDSAGTAGIVAASLREAFPAVRRFALRSLAESVLGGTVPVSREQTREILRLAESPEGGRIDLGQGASLVAESGRVTVDVGSGRSGRVGAVGMAPASLPGPPRPGTLEIPGSLDWGKWSLTAEALEPPFRPSGPDVATLDADRLGDRVEVRSWQEGDRIQPLGMEGSKSLQDLFTDGRVRRSDRHRLPVVLAAGEVVWVPGLAVGENFRLDPDTARAVCLVAEPETQAQDAPLPDWA